MVFDGVPTEAVTPPTIARFLLRAVEKEYRAWIFLPTQMGMPMIMAGTASPATSPMPSGAPTSVPSCHRIFFFLLQGFFPQNVQPDGLMEGRHKRGNG